MTSKENPFFKNLKGEDRNMDELKLVLEEELKPQNCAVCGNEQEIIYSPKGLPYDFNGEERKININNAPYRRCDNCNEETENFRLYLLLRGKLEKEIFFRLNNQEEIPDEIDLFEIVK